jgi:FKBP-type peptidyl-prolyl cis-trans isomerase FkpA
MRMKKMLFPALLAIGAAAIGSCNKSVDTTCSTIETVAPQAEIDSLQRYLTANNITATLDPRGFYYSVSDSGTGTKATACNTVVVDYKGWLTDTWGTVFDQSHGAKLDLVNVINGWREGIPFLAPGGHMMLYIPPTLAYGSTATGTVPANAYLVFQVSLVQIKS